MATSTIDTRVLLDEVEKLCVKPTQKRIHSDNYHRIAPTQYEVIQKLGKAHVDSFNFMLDDGFPKGIKKLEPLEMPLASGEKLQISIIDAQVSNPVVKKDCQARTVVMYPAECRMRGTSYKGKLNLTFACKVNGQLKEVIQDFVGEIPIMLKTKKCNLANKTPKEMIARMEDAEEFGGYFIVNGKERVIRFLTAQRRNYPMALSRKGWKESGQLFTEYGISIRCVRDDQIGSNMVLHYLSNGTARLRFFYQKTPIFLPIVMVLKALCNHSDHYIFTQLVKGREQDTFYVGCVTNMLRSVHQEELYTQQQIKDYIGARFRIKSTLAPWYTEEEVTDYLLRECIATHLVDNKDKFNLLIYMTQKLFAVVTGECAIENPDNPMFHELYLSGHIYFGLLLERMQMYLMSLRQVIVRTFDHPKSGKSFNVALLRRCLASKYTEICRPLEHLIATGNLMSKTGLGLMQSSGISVMAEKINFLRFLAHFRAVHRGAFFSEMKTTTCRKLYPESWGFMCPVHTPDGSPCGLLTHLAEMCMITNKQASTKGLQKVLLAIGMESVEAPSLLDVSRSYRVTLDGKVLGFVPGNLAENFVEQLRCLKATNSEDVSCEIEIAFVKITNKPTQYPGIYIYSTPARMMRPVFNLKTKTVELIGTFEQVYMDICVVAEENIPSVTTHQELCETGIMSVLASQVPFPDFNQSPRNMYACQMCKQTMGTPCHTLKYRSDVKMYSILNPESPLVRPSMHDYYHMDDYPYGTNAVVAVISYTGYDMEDALILNKSAVERGFKHGAIVKNHVVNLREIAGVRGNEIVYMFGRKEDPLLEDKLDSDGLPFIGTKVEFDDPICSYIDLVTGDVRVEKYKSTETAYISDVKLLGSDSGKEVLQVVAITFYIPRRPIIGDKFANRHGQKGVCSFLWPQENMPFTQSGLTPDIIFNPHGYPSRMTIGMMIESMAGKSSSTHGLIHDGTPFMFSEDDQASEYYGKLLQAAGYNYYGTEKMYSGVDGRELKADIFIGVIYYIRLRHMVGDKYQVRSTGPIDSVTHQPVKGRKRCGGIRFGEMERDSLLAHGVSFLLADRLFHQSDKSTIYACTNCGSIISTQRVASQDFSLASGSSNWTCKPCGTGDHVKLVNVPYVLRYLLAELASVNIKLCFDVKEK